MKNAYAREQAELRRQLLNYGALVGQQFNVDMMCLALNEEGFGHDRIMRIIHRAERMPASIARTGRKRKSRKKNGPYTEPTRCIHAISTALDWTARI